MNWNNGYERKQFQKEQEKQNKYYKSLGMSDEAIQAINEFDYEVFKSKRIESIHTQPLDISVFYESDCDESDNALLKKFGEQISVNLEDGGGFSRYWWIEELDTPELAAAINALSQEDKELLTMIVFDQMNHKEIAEILGISRQAVTERLFWIRKRLKKTK